MSEDWKPGDLALCVTVDDRVQPDGITATAGRYLKLGRIYVVAAVATITPTRRRPGLYLVLCDGGHAGAWRFRKIHPHQEDADDREVIAMLTYAPLETETSA